MDIKRHLLLFFDLYKFAVRKGRPTSQSPLYPRFCQVADETLDYYDLPHKQIYYNILLDFVEKDKPSSADIERVTSQLQTASIKIAKKYYLHHFRPNGFVPQPITSVEVWIYVNSRTTHPINYEDFYRIETGFRLIWNYSKPELLSGSDYIRAVDQYLTIIETPYNRDTMLMVVNLILQYLDEMELWADLNF